MGLGKTLTMISLVAMDMEPGREMCAPIDDIPTDKHAVAATLVIVPPPSRLLFHSIYIRFLT